MYQIILGFNEFKNSQFFLNFKTCVCYDEHYQYQEPLRQFQSLRNQIYILSIIKLRMKGL